MSKRTVLVTGATGGLGTAMCKKLYKDGFNVVGNYHTKEKASEAKAELDRFVEAMIGIRKEIAALEKGEADKTDNVLKNAPHTNEEVCGNTWNHAYTREQAAFPVNVNREWKHWPTVSRVDNAFGDRNLVCTCPPIEEYMTVEA